MPLPQGPVPPKAMPVEAPLAGSTQASQPRDERHATELGIDGLRDRPFQLPDHTVPPVYQLKAYCDFTYNGEARTVPADGNRSRVVTLATR